MHHSLQNVALLIVLLVSLVITSPTPLGGISLDSQIRTDRDLSASDASASSGPLGPPRPGPSVPDDITIDFTQESSRLQQAPCLMTAATMVAKLAAEYYDGVLPDRRTEFHDYRNPQLQIVVSSVSTRDRIARRYVLWAMGRIMNDMAIHDNFRATLAVLSYQGHSIGGIWFIAVTNDHFTISANTTQSLNDLTLSSNTTVNDPSNTSLEWAFGF